jgi:hypothetical protein
MFEFIKKLFKKKEEVIIEEIPTVDDQDRQINEYLEKLNKSYEKTEILIARMKEIRAHNDAVLKDLGVKHKFRDTTDGTIYEVEPDDHETFNKMMYNRNMQLVFD